jgi:hypothetical protein
LRLVKVSESNLRVSVEHRVWGAEADRFRSWQIGEYIGFLTSDGLAALAKVSGLPFESNLMIWEGAIYLYRIPIDFVTVISFSQRGLVGSAVRSLLRETLGQGYGMRILKQSLLPVEVGGAVLSLIEEHSTPIRIA